MFILKSSLLAYCLMSSVLAYTQTDSYVGYEFMQNGFLFQAIPDPTHGRVYVILFFGQRHSNREWCIELTLTQQQRQARTWLLHLQTPLFSAQTRRLSSIRTDLVGTLSGSCRTNNIRLLLWCKRSRLTLQVWTFIWLANWPHLIRFNIRHMPQGCGYVLQLFTTVYTYPINNAGHGLRFGLLGPTGRMKWLKQVPHVLEYRLLNFLGQGEIDILEGVNGQGVDQVTLHTGSGNRYPSPDAWEGLTLSKGCSMPPDPRGETGLVLYSSRTTFAESEKILYWG